MKEKWKSCRKIGYPNYLVSNKGRVKVKKTRHIKQQYHRGLFYERGYLRDCQYRYCYLCNKGKRKFFSVHRLVGMIWLKIPEGKNIKELIIHHKPINGKSNVTLNWDCYLQWCTKEEHADLHLCDPDFVDLRVDKDGLPIKPPF